MPMQGSDGPHSDYIGFGATISALAGLVHLSGLPDRVPVGTGTHYPDHIPSPGHALVAVLAALRQRGLTGRGRHVELSQLESMVALLAPAFESAGAGAETPGRSGNRVPEHAPSGVFRCSGDDSWCALAARSDDEWRTLAEAIGAPGLAGDPRFASLEARKANEDALETAITERTATHDRDELAQALQSRGVPAWPVQSSGDLLADAQLRARGFWRTLAHPVMGEFTAPSAPFTVDGERTGPERSAPLLGEHTRELASSLLGLSEAEIDTLTDEKVLW